MAAKYLSQRRELTGFVPRPLGGSQMTYSTWRTVRKHDTETDARAFMDSRRGLYQHRITYRGKTIARSYRQRGE